MRMRFSLATLLHLRKLREEQERAKVAAANLNKVKTQQEAERIRSLRNESSRAGVDADRGTCGAQMRFVQECCAVLGIHEKRAKQRAEEAKIEASKQEQVYLAARRDFEVLENFREKQMEIFRAMELRQEQRELDEAHVLTRAQRSRQALPISSADVAETTRVSDEIVQRENLGRKE